MPKSKPESSDSEDEGNVYEVERIIGKKIIYGEVMYYIKWKDYPVSYNTWEPIDNLSCEQMILNYEAKHSRRNDSLAWEPKPEVILNKEIINGTSEYMLKFDDGETGKVELTYGPMKIFIESYEKKQSMKQKEDEGDKKKPKTKNNKAKKRKMIEGTADADENGNRKDEILIFNHEVERISDMRRSQDGIQYLVQYKNMYDTEWISMQFMKRNHPQKVIDFYERCIIWE